VFAEDPSRRICVATAIAGAHALVLYGLLTMAPALREVATQVPLVVQFVQPESQPTRRPPPSVAVVTPQMVMLQPDLPLIEVPVEPVASDRAITIAPQVAPPTASQEDRSVPKLVSAVEYVRQPAPRYPPQSRRLREQGLVVLRVVIDERGEAQSIEIETSSGHARLDDAAREAVSRAAFRPYIEDGAPRRALVLIPIEFALNRGAA
jgi:protein TonB